MSPAEKLSAASARLRELARDATAGPWKAEPEDGDVWSPGNRERVCRTSSHAYCQDAAYIAAMSPLVALALADWLDAVAAEHSLSPSGDASVDAFFAAFDTAPDMAALALAALIS